MSDTDAPSFKMTDDQVYEFRAKVIKESLCTVCDHPCKSDMAICLFCGNFFPTEEFAKVLARNVSA